MCARRHHNLYLKLDELGREGWETLCSTVRIPVRNDEMLALHVAAVAQPLS